MQTNQNCPFRHFSLKISIIPRVRTFVNLAFTHYPFLVDIRTLRIRDEITANIGSESIGQIIVKGLTETFVKNTISSKKIGSKLFANDFWRNSVIGSKANGECVEEGS